MAESKTAPEILRAMAATYGRCRTYRDTGLHVTHFYREGRPPPTGERPFRTAFVRPDRFRFEYQECTTFTLPGGQRHGTPGHRHIIWSHGTDTRSWWSIDGGEVRTRESLREALHNSAGVSARLSWMVPAMLLPSWGNGKPWKLLDLVRLDDAEIDGVRCYRLRGRFPMAPGHEELCREEVRRVLGEEWSAQADPSTFWVEKDRMVLVRFEEAVQFRDFRSEAIANYRPELDAEVTDADLEPGFPTAEP